MLAIWRQRSGWLSNMSHPTTLVECLLKKPRDALNTAWICIPSKYSYWCLARVHACTGAMQLHRVNALVGYQTCPIQQHSWNVYLKNRVTRLIRHEFVFQVNILTDAWHVYMHAQGQCNFTCDLRAGFSWNARTAGVQSRFYVSNPNLPTDPAIT